MIESLWESGWELGNEAIEITSENVTATAGTPKTGTYAIDIPIGTTTYQEISGGISQCWIGAHVRHGVSSSTRDLFFLRSGTTHIARVQWDATNSQWLIICGATTVATVSDPGFATIDTYFHIGVDVKIDAAAGWVYVYRDGVAVATFDGDTNDGGSTFNRLHLGNSVALSWGSGNRMDDNVWYNTTGESAPAAPHDYRLYAITPNGNGTYNEMDGSDGNAVDNYLLVDDLPHDSDTTYVTTATANDTESVTMTTFTLPTGYSIEEVIALAVAKKVDAGGALGLKVGTRLSSTDLIGTTQTLGTSYGLYRERQTARPGSGAWTQSDLDALEVVIEAAA